MTSKSTRTSKDRTGNDSQHKQNLNKEKNPVKIVPISQVFKIHQQETHHDLK